MDKRKAKKPSKKRTYVSPRIEEDEVFERRALGGCVMANGFTCGAGPYDLVMSG